MARVSYRKKLFKGILQLCTLMLIVYLSFLWKIKTGVDDYLNSQPAQLNIEYHWLLVDWNGNIFLRGVDVYNDDYNRLASAPWVVLGLGSLGALWSLDENVTYQTLPAFLVINASNATSNHREDFFQRLNFVNVPFNRQAIPEICQTFLKSPNNFSFSLAAQLNFQENEESLNFKLDVNSLGFANFVLNGRVDSLSSQNWQNGYLSQLTLSVDQPVWLQMALNRCKEAADLTVTDDLASLFVDRLSSLAEENHYWLSEDFKTSYRQFINLPEQLTFSFSPEAGSTWPQLRHLPLTEIPRRATVSLSLNKQKITSLITPVDISGLPQKANNAITESLQKPSVSYLPVSYRGLKSFVGTRVVIYLKNQTSIKGMIKQVSADRLLLNEYQFGGYSELPYRFGDIDSIEVSENR